MPRVYASRGTRCGSCEGCLAGACGKCLHCLDSTRFGGPGKMKRGCVYRICLNPDRELQQPRPTGAPRETCSDTSTFYSLSAGR
eukprot:6264079-Prymnesium_polylepis.1